MKKERGITLIALVITIIVLLILAGVSISLTLGNNGVLNQATNAVGANRDAKAKEEVEMAWAGATADYWSEWAEDSTTTVDADFYAEKLNIYLADTKKEDVEVTYNDGDETYTVEYVTKDQGMLYTFIMNGDGKATLDSVVKQTPYLADIVGIGDYVDIGIDYDNVKSFDDGRGKSTLVGWRVLSVSDTGKNGIVKLISAGSPIRFRYSSSGGSSFDSMNALKDLYVNLDIVTTTANGFLQNGLKDNTGTINNNLQVVFNRTYINTSNIHALSCKTNNSGNVKAGAEDEFEKLYEAITGNYKTMRQLQRFKFYRFRFGFD